MHHLATCGMFVFVRGVTETAQHHSKRPFKRIWIKICPLLVLLVTALTSVWRFMCSLRVNFLPQISHGYGLSPVCERMCLFRMHWCMAEKLQYGHLNFFLITVKSFTANRQRNDRSDAEKNCWKYESVEALFTPMRSILDKISFMNIHNGLIHSN